MKLEHTLKRFGAVPVTHNTILSILGKYRSPNDKILRMIADGLLLPIKKSLYVVSPELTGVPLSLPLVSNLLYGPSYLSMDYALSHYGIIPEHVAEVTSMTTRRGKVYNLPMGRFSYTHSSQQLYTIGINQVKNADNTCFLMASQEKALCDKLLFTRNLSVSSQNALQELLFDNLRVDEDAIALFEPNIIEACLAEGMKTAMLRALLQLIISMQRKIL
jgi:hypothetical protein